ncbi:hypothetical protein [Variovorax paradoxus]|uniref:hypothetical protein n=2 Tax=Variovorax TaxID=34072 RepID=UPI0019347EE7|nr:hypothetical protein INQ48_35455 [Variovorax paradoxus]
MGSPYDGDLGQGPHLGLRDPQVVERVENDRAIQAPRIEYDLLVGRNKQWIDEKFDRLSYGERNPDEAHGLGDPAILEATIARQHGQHVLLCVALLRQSVALALCCESLPRIAATAPDWPAAACSTIRNLAPGVCRRA